MSLARYLSKLGAMLGSDGKVPQAAMANDAPLGLKSMQVFSTAGTFTWTKPVGIRKVKVIVTGGGGGGGSTDNDDQAAGGGAGATAIKLIDVSSVSSVSVTVGAGKTGNTNGQSNAVVYGNASSFGAYCTAGGGANSGGQWSIGGYGGNASGGDVNIPGGDGCGGSIDVNAYTLLAAGTGGASYWGSGGAGNIRNNAGLGRNGRAPGSGGGGGAISTSSMNGADGIVIVEEYA